MPRADQWSPETIGSTPVSSRSFKSTPLVELRSDFTIAQQTRKISRYSISFTPMGHTPAPQRTTPFPRIMRTRLVRAKVRGPPGIPPRHFPAPIPKFRLREPRVQISPLIRRDLAAIHHRVHQRQDHCSNLSARRGATFCIVGGEKPCSVCTRVILWEHDVLS